MAYFLQCMNGRLLCKLKSVGVLGYILIVNIPQLVDLVFLKQTRKSFHGAQLTCTNSSKHHDFQQRVGLEFSDCRAVASLPKCIIDLRKFQILLILNESLQSPRGVTTKKEQIIGIATIRISYPLSKECTTPTTYKFQKAIDNKATIVASFSLTCAYVSQQGRNKKKGLEKVQDNVSSNGESGQQRKITRQQKLSKINWSQVTEETGNNDGKYDEILKERNELYKMSEDLYEQLKKCLSERDEYLRDLREKELSQQQIKEQLQFLKLKIQQYQSSGNDNHQHNEVDKQQIEQLRNENYDLKRQIEQKNRQMKELQRKVKESLKAMQEFKKQALMAQSELIHKQSQASFFIKKKRFLDPFQCIQELYKQLQNRRIEDLQYFVSNQISNDQSLQSIVEQIKKDLTSLFSQLLQRTKMQKDKQWLLQQKISFERKMRAYLSQS